MVKDMGKDFSHSLIRSCLELSITKKAKSTVTPSWVKIHMPLSSAKANTPPRDLLESGISFQVYSTYQRLLTLLAMIVQNRRLGLLVVKPPATHSSSDFRPLISQDDSLIKFVGEIHAMF